MSVPSIMSETKANIERLQNTAAYNSVDNEISYMAQAASECGMEFGAVHFATDFLYVLSDTKQTRTNMLNTSQETVRELNKEQAFEIGRLLQNLASTITKKDVLENRPKDRPHDGYQLDNFDDRHFKFSSFVERFGGPLNGLKKALEKTVLSSSKNHFCDGLDLLIDEPEASLPILKESKKLLNGSVKLCKFSMIRKRKSSSKEGTRQAACMTLIMRGFLGTPEDIAIEDVEPTDEGVKKMFNTLKTEAAVFRDCNNEWDVFKTAEKQICYPRTVLGLLYAEKMGKTG